VPAFPFLHVNVPGALSPALPLRLYLCAVIFYPLALAHIASLMCSTSTRQNSACLRWGNKGNIWFWHHWLPSPPLGHHYSNPSPHPST
jgi:hypothetical protein